ncbi:MAG: hypothetical protein J6Z01_06515 [Bacteroidales bacterium]|nr:hypothetical protein [Bacteroidales bacterium]
MFSNNTGYVQFEMYDDGKFWVEDYIPGEEATYQWNGENFVTVPTEKPNEEESTDESTADEQTDRYGLDVSEMIMGIAMSEYENNPFEPKYIEKQEKKYDFDHQYVVIDGYILSFDDDGFLLKFKGQDVFMKWNGEKFVE